ncbi:MAG: histidine kinase [Candidatus Zixiibacteriota bacterium]|nr:MAG: histidine kinase [candidate division Zixibacteria bacterium]
MDDTTKIKNDTGLFGVSGWRLVVLFVAVWTLLALIQSARWYHWYNMWQEETVVPWCQALAWGFGEWYLWGLFSLVIVYLTRRITFDRSNWLRSLALHGVLAVIFSVAHIFLYTLGHHVSRSLSAETEPPGTTFAKLLETFMTSRILDAVLIYFLIAFVLYALTYYRRLRLEELRRADLQTRLARAQLESLKGQLHPHFLFNSLNAVTALIHSDPEAADRMVTRLSELLRVAIDSAEVPEVTLREEIEFVRTYLDIQKTRFGDRLRVQLDIAEECLDAMVPNLMLQPLVENAVIHGVTPRSGSGTVSIDACRRENTLAVRVSDDGPGVPAGHDPYSGNGVGLKNTNERLRQLYGESAQLKFDSNDGVGLAVTIGIPYRLETQET